MANDYITIDDVKRALPQLTSSFDGGAQDAILQVVATAACRAIDRYTVRKPGAFKVTADTTHYYDSPLYARGIRDMTTSDTQYGEENWVRSLWVDEMAAAPTEVAVSTSGSLLSYTAFASTDYIMWPYNAPDQGEPYTRIDLDILNGSQRTWYWYRKAIKITGKFGYSANPPEAIVQAATIQAARWYKRAQQAYQDKTEILGPATFVYSDKPDNDIQQIIAHYRNTRIG